MILTIEGKRAVLKKDTSIEYVCENRSFTDADDYTFSITLPLRGCPENTAIFGNIHRLDITDKRKILNATLTDKGFEKSGVVTIVEVDETEIKVQFLAGKSSLNFYSSFDDIYINEISIQFDSYTSTDTPQNSIHTDIDLGSDSIALPWNCNDELQNGLCKIDGVLQWDENTKNIGRLSRMPYLIFVTKKICDAINYTCLFSDWETSEDRYLIICNALPAEWLDDEHLFSDYCYILPHWNLTEFFDELEKLLVGEFYIDHINRTISFAKHSNIDFGEVELNNIINEYTCQCDYENGLCEYKGCSNIKYKDRDDTRWKLDNCPWFIEQYSHTEFTTLDEYSRWEEDQYDKLSTGMPKNTRRDKELSKLFYVKPTDTYFIYIVKQKNETSEYYFYHYCEINRFPDVTFNSDSSEFIELKCVPAYIAEPYHHTTVLSLYPTEDSEEETVDDDGIVQPYAYKRFLEGEPAQTIEFYDKIYLAYWKATYYYSTTHLYPWVDKRFSLQSRYKNYYGGIKIDTKEKTKISWLSDYIPSVRSVFLIKGKRYLCERITATFTESGMSQLLKGEFYLITD